MDLHDILGRIGQYVTMLLPMVIVFGVWGAIIWRRVQRRRDEVKRHKDAGTIGPVGPIGAARLPWHYDKLASLGAKGEPSRTLDDRILRPAIGVRLLATGLAVAVLIFIARPEWAPDGFEAALNELPMPSIIPKLFLLAVALNGVFYILGHEARYNRDMLITTRMFVSRREFRWKDLLTIGDDGAYELVLTFAVGGKAKVLKHARGIEDFKAFAMSHLQKNR